MEFDFACQNTDDVTVLLDPVVADIGISLYFNYQIFYYVNYWLKSKIYFNKWIKN